MTGCSACVQLVEHSSAPRAGTRQRALTGPTCKEVEMAERRVCAIQGCGKPSRKRGWCPTHYARWQRHGDPIGGRSYAAHGAPTAFLEAHVDYAGVECLTWPFSTNRYGYGRIYDGAKFTTASRAMCELAHGAPPSPRHEAAHICGMGHKGCVNPSHLRWATPAENAGDTLSHGTRNRGERNGASRLTKSDVRRIRNLAGQLSQAELGELFGIHVETVGRIVRGTRWGWLA